MQENLSSQKTDVKKDQSQMEQLKRKYLASIIVARHNPSDELILLVAELRGQLHSYLIKTDMIGHLQAFDFWIYHNTLWFLRFSSTDDDGIHRTTLWLSLWRGWWSSYELNSIQFQSNWLPCIFTKIDEPYTLVPSKSIYNFAFFIVACSILYSTWILGDISPLN